MQVLSQVTTLHVTECISVQSNWSGPFSQVVVSSLYNLRVVSLIPSLDARQNFLHTFFSYYNCTYKSACTLLI